MDKKRITVWFCFIVYCLCACGNYSGTVVCYGADGHIEIETVHDHCSGHAEDCHGHEQDGFLPELTVQAVENGCGGCFDVQIPSDKLYVKNSSTNFKSMQVRPGFAGLLINQYANKNVGRFLSSRSGHTLSILQSTILLI